MPEPGQPADLLAATGRKRLGLAGEAGREAWVRENLTGKACFPARAPHELDPYKNEYVIRRKENCQDKMRTFQIDTGLWETSWERCQPGAGMTRVKGRDFYAKARAKAEKISIQEAEAMLQRLKEELEG